MKAKFNHLFGNEERDTKELAVKLFNTTLQLFHFCIHDNLRLGLGLNLSFCKLVADTTPSIQNEEIVERYCSELGLANEEEMTRLYGSMQIAVFDSYMNFIREEGDKILGYKNVVGHFNEKEGKFYIIAK